jgi:polyketide cyclase/dehydrase/lipid transport protein
MKTWTATTTVDAAPEAVLDVLTDPDAIARWAPLPFDVDDLDTPRLMAGSTARVSGRLAGRRVGFVVEVHEAEYRRLSLAADGPVGLDVSYELAATKCGSEVHAAVSVRSGKGITGRLLAEATNALLSAGALTHAISRLAAEAACPA